MNRALQGGLILGDAIVLYLALLVMLFIRYGTVAGRGAQSHFSPFTILFLIWILVFYIAGLYDVRSLKNNSSFARKLALALTTNFLFAIAFFYFVPGFGITPKTNLVIFLVLFSLGMYVWRTSYNTALLARGRGVRRILIVGYNQVAQELSDFI
ncbi:hypothetical protein HY478_02960, partial [Candidatus Uhrbacteria bacterium]|nr:hypothetical protein [Candidatus Uhrbacteria bacterium]